METCNKFIDYQNYFIAKRGAKICQRFLLLFLYFEKLFNYLYKLFFENKGVKCLAIVA